MLLATSEGASVKDQILKQCADHGICIKDSEELFNCAMKELMAQRQQLGFHEINEITLHEIIVVLCQWEVTDNGKAKPPQQQPGSHCQWA